MSLNDGFALLRHALEKAGVRYAVGGSWASSAFGEPRSTNDVDVLADLNEENIGPFLSYLPDSFFSDDVEARKSLLFGKSFNVIYAPMGLKFDLFPARAFALGASELERAVFLEKTDLSPERTPFVTPEDILLAKLSWFKLGRQVSEMQWRDIHGIVRACGASMDQTYLETNAIEIGVADLLAKALRGESAI